MVLFDVPIMVVLVLIFIQDIRSRSVYWFWFPILFLLFVSAALLPQHRSFSDIGQTAVINCTCLVLQYLLLTLYFSLKNRRWVNVMSEMLGWGDVLLLLCIACYLSVLNFVLFYIVSLAGVLLSWLIWQTFSKQKSKHIPLAGLQAVMFGLFVLICRYSFHLNIADDSWVLSLLTKWI